MRVIYSTKSEESNSHGPLLTILLDDYDIVHNKYLENRVTMNLDNYDETNESRHATKVIDFLGCNKTQIKKNVITANMETNWKNILERVLDMFDKEMKKLIPHQNHDENCKHFAYFCTKRPFVALYEKIVAHENQQLYIKKHKNHNQKYSIEDYLSAF